MNKPLTKDEARRVKLLLDQGVKPEVAAEVMGVSRTTVARIRDGEHYLSRGKEPAKEKTPAEEKTDEPAAADEVLRLLNEINQGIRDMIDMWKND